MPNPCIGECYVEKLHFYSYYVDIVGSMFHVEGTKHDLVEWANCRC